MKIKGKTAFVMILFVVAAFILTLKILTPSHVNVYVEESRTVIDTGLKSFSLMDVAVMLIAAVVLTICGMYLLFSDRAVRMGNAVETILNDRKKRWKEISKTLKNDEQVIHEVIINSDGIIAQSEIVEMTGLSKSTVSRALDMMESKGLVERKRRGMGNLVLLR